MESVSRVRGRWRELAVLAAGLAAAVALVLAGLSVHDGLRTAREVAVARLAGAVEDTVLAEWERMRRADGFPVAPAGESFAWTAPLAPLELRAGAREAGRLSVFETLLAEAERLELVEDDPAGALELVEEALVKDPEAPRRAEGWLRAIQLAARLERADVAAAHWDELREVDLAETRDGIPCRLLGWLALPAGLRARAPAGELARPEELERLFTPEDRLTLGPPEDPQARFEPAPMLLVVLARMELDPPPLERRKALALERLAGALPEIDEEERWQLRELAARPFLVRRSGAEMRGAFVSAAGLAATLAERAALADGFALDLAGDGEALGPAVRPRAALPGSPLAFTLRHGDPARLGRAESSRLRLLRAALLALALACAAGGFLTARVLARQRKLAELKSAFIAGVSHDLRTPLASIVLLAENLEAGIVDGPQRARYHGALLKEATRLRRLVDDVLDFSRLERGEAPRLEREEVDLARFLDGLEPELRARVEAEERVFRCERGELPESAALDAAAVRRALENLVDNALKHGAGSVRLACGSGAGRLRFAVADEGAGVSEADRERVFEPFERLDRANGHAGGTGLGLAIVRAIARAHGGEARVRAGEGGAGSVFELDLPLVEAGA